MNTESVNERHRVEDADNKIKGLYAIVDNTFSPNRSHLELAIDYLSGGCKILQLRMKRDASGIIRKNYWDRDVFEVAKSIAKLKTKYDFTFIVNDYVDVAAEIKADGIHVGANDMSVDKVRERVGTSFIIGYSSHSVEEALLAEKAGAGYVALGAIFQTKTKGPGHPVQGIDNLKNVVSQIDVPVVAIGGINRENIGKVVSTGVSSVAMITALSQAKDPVLETKWYVDFLNKS